MSVSDLWRGMASRKWHVSELKNWMPMHSKTKKPSVGVECRAGGDPQGGVLVTWGSGLIKNMHSHPVFPTEVWLLVFDLSKVSKILMTWWESAKWLILIMNCSKSAKWLISILTCSKSAKWLFLILWCLF